MYISTSHRPTKINRNIIDHQMLSKCVMRRIAMHEGVFLSWTVHGCNANTRAMRDATARSSGACDTRSYLQDRHAAQNMTLIHDQNSMRILFVQFLVFDVATPRPTGRQNPREPLVNSPDVLGS